mmetsp:Transcript_109602/g.261397  ORF Transcript_109602/g.261397 Transcript_109602/m.261397 type:complete len:208 (+) Transcript_109602:518-1141(+)
MAQARNDLLQRLRSIHHWRGCGPDDGAVAEIVLLHDGRVQGRKVQGHHRLIVEPAQRIQHGAALIGVAALIHAVAVPRLRWQHVPVKPRLAQEHREHLYALTSREQILHGHPGDPGHLHVAEKAVLLVEELHRQACITARHLRQLSGILSAELLQVSGTQLQPGFLEKVERQRRQGVGAELVLHLGDPQQVEEEPALSGDVLGLVLA